jgi:hypothetical protein
MALSLTSYNAYVNSFIVPRSFQLVYKHSPLFVRARTRQNYRFEGGKQIQQPIVPFKLVGSSFGRASQLSTSWVNTETAFQVQMKFYYVSVVLLGADGVFNMGPEAALSQAELKIANAAGLMGELLSIDLYLSGLSNANVITNLASDSDPLSLDGFAQWVDDGTNVTTVGGITRTDIGTNAVVGGGNGYFQNVAGQITTTILNLAMGSTSFGPDNIDMWSCSPITWTYVLNRLQGNQRFLREDTDVAKAGFKSIEYLGAEIVRDNYAPAGAMLGLNTEYFMFYISTNPLFQFGFTGWKVDQGTIDYVGQFLFSGNVLYPNPRTGAYLVGITS